MAVIPKPVMTFRFHFDQPEEEWTTTAYASIDGTVGGPEDVLAIANAVSAGFHDVACAVLSEQVTYLGIYARYQSSVNDWEANSGADAGPGLRDGEALPVQDCVEIRRLTGLGGRAKRGRFFFSGLSEEDQENGHVISSQFGPWNALAGFLSTDAPVGDRTVHWRHWDRKNSVLVPITQCKPVARLVSRRDRAKNEAYVPMGA